VPADEADVEAKAAGADEVMSKPFSALDLLHRLSSLLEG
jgi:DNA-binding response OmpR family regulator